MSDAATQRLIDYIISNARVTVNKYLMTEGETHG